MTGDVGGLCYSEGFLYVLRCQEFSLNLTVHSVQPDSAHITELDTLTVLLEKRYLAPSLRPRMDHHSRRVFIPCLDSGVTVARLDGDRLVTERTLTCIRRALSVDVMSPDTVYVGDSDSRSVHVVNVIANRITSTLMKPDTLRDQPPYSLAVLGDSVMVGYSGSNLVIYRHGSPAPVRVIPRPGGLMEVSAISTDYHSNFIVTGGNTSSMFIIDSAGNLHHTIKHTASMPEDCVVVNGQLWVSDFYGIVIMSSR